LSLLAIAISGVICAQDFSNKGKDFWIGYANHVRMYNSNSNQQEKMSLYITSDVNTTGSVEIPGLGWTQPLNVTANQITVVDIPKSARLLDDGLFNLGIHVIAQRPVVVYAHIYAQNVSGATVCLPTVTLGKEYFSVNYTQESNETPSYSYMLAIATEDNTTIEITPAVTTKKGWLPGSTHQVNLDKGQVFQVLADSDLTGSTIKSVATTSTCKKIAVYCGSGKVYIKSQGCTTNSADNLFQQMYPTATWGKHYITVSSKNNTIADQTNIYRIVKSDPAAQVFVDGNQIPARDFVNGFYYEFSKPGVHVITSDKPILVAQYFSTESCYSNGVPGDPEMIYLNPVEQTINAVTLYSSQFYLITEHFINIVIKNTGTAISSLRIDGQPVAVSFANVPLESNYSYARIQVQAGTHTITSDSGFNAIAYGFGNAESYGYSAGTNLKDLYQFVSIQNEYAIVDFPAGCRNSPLKFAMTFPYQPTQLKWVFGESLNTMGIADTLIMNPRYDSSWVINGRTLYRYNLKRISTVTAIGTYPIRVLANNPTADGCSGDQEIDYDLQIFERPKATFSVITNGCLSDSVAFMENTNGEGRPIIKWTWNFDDATSSSLKNPKHKFNLAKSYNVRFSAITDVGCVSDTANQLVEISNPPLAVFQVSGPACVNQQLSFVDHSNPLGSTLTKWSWDFGDGNTVTNTNSNRVFNTFNSLGSYNVSLQVENIAGCKSAIVTTPVQVNSFPSVDFAMPEVCLSDPFAQFTDLSSINDNSASQFTYLWNFGDSRSTTGNPNISVDMNPKHTYAKDGVYAVQLKVTSKDGCAKDTVKQFTVNGAVPTARFQVMNENRLCSNAEVSLVDNSTVDFGNIVRVEIYWDYQNDPTKKTIDEDPHPNKIYTHQYPEFGSPSTTSHQIRYVSYSGINCISQTSKTITLLASPQVQFDPIAGVCEEIPSFQVTAAREITGVDGTGIFSGAGISPSGVFNPSIARPGLHNIRYTFTALNGCNTFKEQNITVYPTPLVDLGSDKFVLEGGFITMTPATSGNQLSFSWTPTIGVSNSRIAAPRFSPTEDITYRLTVTSGDGCVANDQVFVKVLKKPQIPNAFSPNGDGINDTWEIQHLESYPGCTVEVYNRYGQMIFYSVGYSTRWDGTHKGTALPVGTYYWVVDPKNGREPMKGSVTIIR